MRGLRGLPRGRRVGTPRPEAGPRGSAAGGVTDDIRRAPGQPKRLSGARGSGGAGSRVPGPGRGASVARPRALFPGPGMQGGVGAVGSGGKRPFGPPAAGSAPRSSLGGGGVFGSSQAGEVAGGVMWKGLPVAPEKPYSRGSLSTWAELQELGTWKPSRRRTPRHRLGRVLPPPPNPTSVCSNSDTKHEFRDNGLLETFIYVCIVKCGHWRVTGFFPVFFWMYLVIKKVIQDLEAENCNSTVRKP